MKFKYLLSLGVGIYILSLSQFSCTESSGQGSGIPDEIDYNFHIRPILADNCFACHGPDAKKRKAKQ